MTSSKPDAALHAVVHGRVQGVGFRIFVQRRAQELGLTGTVRNLDGGTSVEVVAEGPRAALDSLLTQLHAGPTLAQVEDVDVERPSPTGAYSSFDGADPAHTGEPGQADVALRAFVHGRVQGVGFRAFVQQRAREVGIRGFVRNLSDGVSVEVVAEGSFASLDALLASLRIGPSGSYVEKVDASWGEATGRYQGFVSG
jgi:acylphosphatase